MHKLAEFLGWPLSVMTVEAFESLRAKFGRPIVDIDVPAEQVEALKVALKQQYTYW